MKFAKAVTFSAVFFGVAIPASVRAAAINFGSGTNFVNAATDVQPLAVVDKAYDFGAGSLSINGVAFTDFNSQVTDPKTGLGNQYNGYGTAGQAGNYGTLLSNADWSDGGSSSITLNGLTNGQTYRIEVWVNDSRQPGCCGTGRTNVYSGDAAGTDGVALFNQTSGPSGQYVIGSFTASGTSQVLNIDLNSGSTNNNQINGLLLSHAVPEPASLGLLGLGGLGLLARRRRA